MSFEKFYKTFLSPLTRFVFKRMGVNPNEADEIVSTTFIAAWKGFSSFKHKSTYFTWLCRIALNKIADYYRDQIHERSHIITPALKAMSQVKANDISPVERLALKELCDKVNACLNLLPYEKRRLLWFRYWADLSYDQIGKILGIPPRAVEGRLYRARHEFGKAWTARL